MPATLQREFHLDLASTDVLYHPETAANLARKNRGEIMAAVQEGLIRFAFNIGLDPDARAEVRIYVKSFEQYLRDLQQPRRLTPERDGELDEVINHIVPPSKGGIGFIRGNELQKALACHHAHIANLLDAKLLSASTKPQRGPNGSPFLVRASAVRFLKSRRLYAAPLSTTNSRRIP